MMIAALAALAHTMGGNAAEARRLLAPVVALLEGTEGSDYVHGISLDFATLAAWRLEAADLAPRLRTLALRALESREGTAHVCCTELDLARMAALQGDAAEARRFFANARTTLEARGSAPFCRSRTTRRLG